MRFALLIAGFVGLALNAAAAADYQVGPIRIADPWSRATPKGASVGAGYMTITNTGTTPDRLVAGSANVAASFEVHEMTMENNVMRMRSLAGGLDIKPGETVELKPGALHVMLVGLKKPLAAGDRVSATLVFEKAGKVEIEYEVRPIGAPASGHGKGHGH
jgi:periplasmic copper chaperone A